MKKPSLIFEPGNHVRIGDDGIVHEVWLADALHGNVELVVTGCDKDDFEETAVLVEDPITCMQCVVARTGMGNGWPF